MIDVEREIVSPGDLLGLAKEYKAGNGTYIYDGEIRAKVMGLKVVDEENKRIEVVPFKEIKQVKLFQTVLGEVVSVSNTIANIKIYGVLNGGVYTPLISPISGTLHISQLGRRVNRISDYMKIGDVIRAKVILDRTIPVSLTVSSRDLGIVAAYCGSCGGVMRILDRKKQLMICTKCGKKENRKLSNLYDFNRYTMILQLLKPKKYEHAGE